MQSITQNTFIDGKVIPPKRFNSPEMQAAFEHGYYAGALDELQHHKDTLRLAAEMMYRVMRGGTDQSINPAKERRARQATLKHLRIKVKTAPPRPKSANSSLRLPDAVGRKQRHNRRIGIGPGLRFQIFKRDHYRCQLCGTYARDDLTLEVDHKIPVAKGGTNAPHNLWTLCFDCNRGKSDLDL